MDIMMSFYQIKKKFKDISKEFLEFIKDKRLIIHNAEFDLSHINNELKLLGKGSIKNEIIDTLVLAREKFPGSSISLDALCKRYRVDNTKRTLHTALIDCDLLAKIYINLIGQKEPTLDFKNQDSKIKNEFEIVISYFKKVITPSEHELQSHKDYLKSHLKKNFF
jgi:DNA polymerase-3 subunit epsilon